MMEAEECWRVGMAESSLLTRSFWMGLYLQRVEGAGGTCSHITGSAASVSPDNAHHPCCRAELARRALTVETTSLSPNVHDLVTGAHSRLKHTSTDSPHLLSSDGTLNWPAVAHFLEQGVCTTDKDYTSGGRRCAELAFLAHEELSGRGLLSKLERREQFEWTQSPELFVSLLEEVWSEEGGGAHTALLLGTAALERALRDVYVSVTGGAHSPLLLRDLLVTRELEQVLGPTAVYILCCMIGPPAGLNLRNIVWHGFSSLSEIPKQYPVFLLVLTASLSTLLPPHTHTTPRHYLTLTQEHRLSAVFNTLEPGDCAVLEELLSTSFFILPSMLPTWRAALGAFIRGRYAHCLVLVLPALEHGLRRVFACVNNCPQRVLTAESTTLYTTFDEILSPVLPSGEPNKFIIEVGEKKMEMLLDALTHSEGPRLRDRISHGEVDLCRLSGVLANHVLCVSLLFCAQYCLRKDLLRVPVLSSLLRTEREYVSLFHPLSLLRQEILQLLSTLTQWKSVPKPEALTDHLPTSSADSAGAAFKGALQYVQLTQCSIDLCRDGVGGVECVRGVVERVWGEGVSMLFMERRDLELVGVVRRTVDNTHQATSQILETATLRCSQFRDKQLRSRQRPNYQHLLSSMELYWRSVLLLMVLSLACVSHIPMEGQQQGLIRYQKKLLQCSENIRSQCSPSRNRWEEVDKLCHSLTELSRTFPSKRL